MKSTYDKDGIGFTKIVNPGTLDGHRYFVKVEHHADDPLNPGSRPSLSFQGVHGPDEYGNAYGGCGQHSSPLTDPELDTADGWTPEGCARLAELWDLYHLPGLQAGTPAQMAHLRELSPGDEWRDDPRADTGRGYPTHYKWAKAVLADAGLEPDYGTDGAPYWYGSQWLRITVPAEVLDELRNLPDASTEAAWV